MGQRMGRPLAIRQRGLSLLEVLIVLWILMLLFLAIFPPRHNGTREHANRARCLNNLKQIGMALVMYETKEGARCPWGPMARVQTDPSDPNSMTGGLFDEGNGILADADIFRCPTGDPSYCPTTSQYLRSWWDEATLKPNVVIAGDFQDPSGSGRGNHEREFSNFLYKDGHVNGHTFPSSTGPLDATGISGAADATDDMYTTTGDAAAGSGLRTALIYNDG